jgi:hypothetical protein
MPLQMTAAYTARSSKLRRRYAKEREEAGGVRIEALKAAAGAGHRGARGGWRARDRETGAWLTAMPDRLNGTDLSADEFRDSLRLRLGLIPTSLPARCDGCRQMFSVAHAMSCKKGGLVLLRHNDVKAEWLHLCATALSPSAVSDEPLIHSGRGRQTTTGAASTEIEPELRGDVSAHGFWTRGTTAIFDVRITDTDAPSQRGMDPERVLAKHEEEKKAKYLEPSLQRRRQFTPLVFSVDGLRGVEAVAASKRLASSLAKKWRRTPRSGA